MISATPARSDVPSKRHKRGRSGRHERRAELHAVPAVSEPAAETPRTHKKKSRSERPERSERPARPQRSERPERRSATGAELRSQLKLWLSAIDTTLTAIERTAWEVRALGDSTRSLFERGQREVVTPMRKAGDDLRTLPQRFARLTSTGLVLGGVATAYRLHSTKAAFMSEARASEAHEALHASSAKSLYELSIRQGGAFLKLGQMLASRPDLLPAAYIRELEKLQDAAPPVAFADVRRVLEAELGQPIAALFAELCETPIAAASIGQVHRGVLHDGRVVAVKVQRPNVDKLVALDMSLLEVFVRALAEKLPPLDFDTIIRETRAMIDAELDYCREADITAQMSAFFAGTPNMGAPAVVRELSTQRVLVTEFRAGDKITRRLDALVARRDQGDSEAQAALTELLSRVLESYARQVLEAGVFQADPHPGNLLADEAGNLTVLDFGCAKVLEPAQRDNLRALLKATLVKDYARMAEAMERMGFRTASGTREGLEGYARAALGQLATVSADGGFVNQLEMIAKVAEFGRFVDSDPIAKLPEEFVMLGRVFGTLSGLFVHYRPDVSAVARVLPVVMVALMS
jgi:ubiquinone biosynthesis protein